jgi:non-specific serine/threonine protein kinase
MGIPAPGVQESVSSLVQYEAVELFVERAKQVRQDFALTDENVEAVISICRKLDGLPLALELAAARARVLSASEILERLQDRLKLLTGGSRDLPGRQQTMRAAIEWSYELLSDSEKDVFSKLSVFRGGFSYNDAETVIRQSSSDRTVDSDVEILDIITSINEKSLLTSVKSHEGPPRFHMLEVVRDYASEVLAARGDAETILQAHAKYFLSLTAEAEPKLKTIGSAKWFRRLETEHDNIRAAIGWAIENDLETAARLTAYMRTLWVTHGHIREGKRWLEEILKAKAILPSELRWDLLMALGSMNQFQGLPEAAHSIYLEALDESRNLVDQKRTAQSLRGIAAIEYIRLNFPAARERANEGLEISRSIGDEFGAAAALARLGDIAAAEGDPSESRRRTGEAFDIFKRLGYKQGIAAKGSNLGAAEYLDGDIESARRHMVESLRVSLEVGDEIDTRNVFDGFAALAFERRDFANAARLAGAAEARGEAIGYTLEPAERKFREFYLDRIRLEMDVSDFDQAYSEGRKMSAADAADLAFAIST